MTIRSTSKLRCEFEKTSPELFFSLVDYRNKLFTSNEPEKILEFYNGFDNRVQFLKSIKERSKGVSYFHEFESGNNNINAILISDFEGKYAKETNHQRLGTSKASNNVGLFLRSQYMTAVEKKAEWYRLSLNLEQVGG